MNNERTLLYGADEESNIVAIENLKDRKNIVQIYSQTATGVVSRYEKFDPFIYIQSNDNILQDLKDVRKEYLLGTNVFDMRIHSQNVATLFWVKKNAAKSMMPMMNSQYQIDSGKTLFKGMKFDDVVRLYLDIEVKTAEGFDFPNPDRSDDAVIIVSFVTNTGEEMVIHGDDEKDVLTRFLKEFRRIDPTVVVGHNSSNFDLPYLETRFRLHGIDFALGRNGSAPEKFLTSIKLAEKSKEYWNWQLWGRHTMDTMFMAMQWDIVQRKLPSYGLKDIAKTLGFATEDREYVEGNQITALWTSDRERLLRYALDDVRETKKLDEFFAQPYFYLTQMVPMSYQDVWRYGTGTKIDGIFTREYYRSHWSLPEADPKREYGGGYADAFVHGMVEEHLAYVDVKSLYPTIMETAGICSKKDELGVFPITLSMLKEMRFKAKALAKTFSSQGLHSHAAVEDARQNVMKILINSYYGWLGWEFGMFNDYDEAERVTVTGQSIIRKMIEIGDSIGAPTIKADTDGALMVVPAEYRGSMETELKFVAIVQDKLNEWYTGNGIIELDHDGRYAKALIVDKKSYVLLNHDGKVTLKGNTLRSRSMESYARDFIDRAVKEIMTGSVDLLPEVYADTRFMIETGLLTIEQISYKRELNQSLEEYKNKRKAGANPIAQYEVAVNSPRPYRKGDRVTYYITPPQIVPTMVRGKEVMRPEKVPVSALARESKDYAGEYWIEHYLSRFDEVTKRLLIIVGEEKFRELFPGIRLTPKDLRKIQSDEEEE